jgi:hypothetical protein
MLRHERKGLLMQTITSDHPQADHAPFVASNKPGDRANGSRSEPAAPPRVSLRFDSAAGPLTGVLIDERTGQTSWFMGWLELIRAIEATLPWRDATLSDDAGALSLLVTRACRPGRSAVQ